MKMKFDLGVSGWGFLIYPFSRSWFFWSCSVWMVLVSCSICVWGQPWGHGALEVSGTWVLAPSEGDWPCPCSNPCSCWASWLQLWLEGLLCLSWVSRQTEPLWKLGTALSTCWAQRLQFDVLIGVKMASLAPVICYMQLLGDTGSAFISVLLSTVST